VICIKSHSKGLYIKDKVYTIKAIHQGCCRPVLDLGIKQGAGYRGTSCHVCGKSISYEIFLAAALNFVSIQSQHKSISYSKILEEIEEQHQALIKKIKSNPLELNIMEDEFGTKHTISNAGYEYVSSFTDCIKSLLDKKPVKVRGNKLQIKMLQNQHFAQNFAKQKGIAEPSIKKLLNNQYAVAY